MSANISMKALLESGVHFGHRTNKWDPRMRPYIFTERNGIHIIDLQQTVKYLEVAYNIVRDTVANGGTVMFVGTKRQAQETIQEEAIRCGMPFVTERWLPGTLTNWTTINARIMELERLEKLRDSGEIDRLVKKEGLMIEREINRLLTTLVGIRNMKRLPELLFIIDVSREMTAVHEANLKNIPIVALVDTNCDPTGVDYIVPANDDAIRAIKLLVGKVADAVLEGKAMRKEEVVDDAGLLADEAARAADLSRGHIELEVELDDEDLLGSATLAKMALVKPAIVEAVVADIKQEEIEKPVEKVKLAKQASIKPEKTEKPAEKVKATRKKKVVEKPVLDEPETKEQDKE
jgi:small subunit ribosomal protein S2